MALVNFPPVSWEDSWTTRYHSMSTLEMNGEVHGRGWAWLLAWEVEVEQGEEAGITT